MYPLAHPTRSPLWALLFLWCSAGLLWAQSPAADTTLPPPPEDAVVAADLKPGLPTIFIAGDSTAANGSTGAIGWGRLFPAYFDLEHVNIANRARGGRSSRTFITEGHWDKLLAEAKPGDWVLIQFGHNDGGAINEEPPGSTRPLRARGTLPGLGDESQDIVNAITQQPETVYTYGHYLRRMIREARAKGTYPVVMTLTGRNLWKDGLVERGNGAYPAWAREIAAAEGTPLIDLTDMVTRRYQAMGPDKTAELFPKDHTHTSETGADLNAALVVAALRGLAGDPVRGWLNEQGLAIRSAPWAVRDGAEPPPNPAESPDVPPASEGEAARRRWLNLPLPTQATAATLFCVGDSTVRNGRGDGNNGQWGWGDFLAPYFDAERLEVVNRAIGGLSSRTYYLQQWSETRSMIKSGDFVIIQLGHNDNAALNDDSRARGTIKGAGDEWERIDNQLTKLPEVVHSYGWYLRQIIAETRARGATPILCSPVPRKRWEEGRIARAPDSYPAWAAEVAESTGTPFLDLHELVAQRYEAAGQATVDAYFGDAHTHTSRAGAALNAEVITTALRALEDSGGLGAYLLPVAE